MTNKKPIWDLKMGGGIGREAVSRGAVLGGRLYMYSADFSTHYMPLHQSNSQHLFAEIT